MCTSINEDPRQQHMHPAVQPDSALLASNPDARQPKAYKLGDATVHAYASMAFKRCEVCGPLGKRCPKQWRSGGTFSCAPYAQGVTPDCMRLLCAPPECVAQQCFAWNVIALEPLKVSKDGRRGSTALSFSEYNNKLLESALRHCQVPYPVKCEALCTRLSQPDRCLVSKSGVHLDPTGPRVNQGYTGGMSVVARESHISERLGRIFWLHRHPSMPVNYSFEEKLRLSPHTMQLARNDIQRAEKRDRLVKVAILDANRKKLLGDVEALLESKEGLKSQNLCTVEALDAHFPGVQATINRILSTYNEGECEHALDVAFTCSLVNVAEMMAVDLRRYDQSFSTGGRVASGRAYSWITGLAIGLTPGVSLAEIANKLNDDPRILRYDHEEWRNYVTAMHVFDALQWDALKVEKRCAASAGMAGGSNDVMGSHEGNKVFYTIGIGTPEFNLKVGAEVTYPGTRAEWVAIHASVEETLDKMGLEADLPGVPSQAQIDELQKPECEATFAVNWIEYMAQTMAYWPKTRPIGLDILTNYSVRGFVAAVGTNMIDLEMLDLATALKNADGVPME
jgi:hypothetical protein